MYIKVGFVHLANSTTQSDIAETHNALIRRYSPEPCLGSSGTYGACDPHARNPRHMSCCSDEVDGQERKALVTMTRLGPGPSPRMISHHYPIFTPTPSPTAASLPPPNKVPPISSHVSEQVLVPIECRDQGKLLAVAGRRAVYSRP